MKKQVILPTILVLLVLLSGCKTLTTGKAAADICDDTCQQEKDNYIKNINDFLTQAQITTSKVDSWKTVTKEDMDKITSLKNQVSALKMPKDFEMVHDYYQRAFNHYVEAIDYIIKANEEYSLASDFTNLQTRNIAMTKVVNNIQEANKALIYAEEEVKFATRLVSKD